MDTLQEQQNFIEKLVKSNNKFSGNEDLLEDFCSETYKRSHSLIENAEIDKIGSYLAKVANTAILTVLKENGRVRRRENKYVSTNEILMNPIPARISSEPAQKNNTENISNGAFVYEIADPRDSFEEKIARKDLLQKVVDVILIAQKEDPTKDLLKIFYMRYVQDKKQKEIAETINISQSEVSKRLVEISQVVKNSLK